MQLTHCTHMYTYTTLTQIEHMAEEYEFPTYLFLPLQTPVAYHLIGSSSHGPSYETRDGLSSCSPWAVTGEAAGAGPGSVPAGGAGSPTC